MTITKDIIWVLALGKKESATSMDFDLAFNLSRWNADTKFGRKQMLIEAQKAGYAFDCTFQCWKKQTKGAL